MDNDRSARRYLEEQARLEEFLEVTKPPIPLERPPSPAAGYAIRNGRIADDPRVATFELSRVKRMEI